MSLQDNVRSIPPASCISGCKQTTVASLRAAAPAVFRPPAAFARHRRACRARNCIAGSILPGSGQAEVAAVAVQEFGLDGVFQVADVFACHCGGDAERVGGAGEAAALDDLAENLEAEQGVHIFLCGKSCINKSSIYLKRGNIYTLPPEMKTNIKGAFMSDCCNRIQPVLLSVLRIVTAYLFCCTVRRKSSPSPLKWAAVRPAGCCCLPVF